MHDSKGRLLPICTSRIFRFYENGVKQSIRLFRHEDIPVTVGLVIDHSGSMRPKLTDVVAAARTFVRSSNPEDQMFVVNFNEKVTLGLPDDLPFTNRPEGSRERGRQQHVCRCRHDGALRRGLRGAKAIAGRQPGKESADCD